MALTISETYPEGLRPVVGLDLSLTSTGIAHFDEVSVIRSSSKGMQRIDEIRNTVMGVIGFMDDPLVVIEGYAFAKKTAHAAALGELGGVIRWTLFTEGIQYVEVPPTSRAKFASGRGNAPKSEVVSAVSARTGMVFSGAGADDLCDAFVLQEMGVVGCGGERFSWPKAQLEVAEKIEWPERTE